METNKEWNKEMRKLIKGDSKFMRGKRFLWKLHTIKQKVIVKIRGYNVDEEISYRIWDNLRYPYFLYVK